MNAATMGSATRDVQHAVAQMPQADTPVAHILLHLPLMTI